jgi:ADP-dependent NAD(P)H-hydrate dehydratase / NAD(P)H-hydrate epimerase
MRVIYPSEMAALDKAAIEGGIPSLDLMESAGRSIANNAMDMLNTCDGKEIAIVVGKGNNGGDGLVAARYLSTWGALVSVHLLTDAGELTPDSRSNYERYRSEGGAVLSGEVSRASLSGVDLVIDGIFGTGFKGSAQGVFVVAIEAMNASGAPVLAIDIPSGIDGETGQVDGDAVVAARTVTFAWPKTGLYLHPGASHVGELIVADIGIPLELLERIVRSDINTVEGSEVSRLLPRRPSHAYKGMAGRVLVVAGSRGLTGAAALTARAALRAGAGVVTLGIAEGLCPIMEMKLTEVMKLPLPDYRGVCLGDGAAQRIMEAMKSYDVLALGPGLGTEPATCRAVLELLAKVEKPIILDADGINCAAMKPESLEQRSQPTIITPHPGELGRLMNKPAVEIEGNRLLSAMQAGQRFGCCVVLKGANTIISAPGERVLINPLALASLATAGSGDVLAGCISALAAQSLPLLEAAFCGVYLHGDAAVIASHIIGSAGMIAGDIISHLPLALSGLLNEGGWTS